MAEKKRDGKHALVSLLSSIPWTQGGISLKIIKGVGFSSMGISQEAWEGKKKLVKYISKYSGEVKIILNSFGFTMRVCQYIFQLDVFSSCCVQMVLVQNELCT